MTPTRALIATFALVLIAAGVAAQQTGFSRTVLQRGDISTPNHEVVTAVAEFQPGATVGMMERECDRITAIVVNGALVDGHHLPRPSRIVADDQVAAARACGPKHEMNFLTVLPRMIERGGSVHRQCGRR